MFRKLHLHLTIFCAAITICILCIFTALYLYIAENTLTDNHYLSFQHDMDTLCTNLEQQITITHQYLLKLKQSNDYLLFLWDNDQPFYFNSLNYSEEYQILAEQIKSYYTDTLLPIKGNDDSAHHEFIYEDDNNRQYVAGIAQIYPGQLSAAQILTARTNAQGLTLLAIYPRESFLEQLKAQRMWFILIAAVGCILLTAFAWLFTRRLIKPLQENQQKQIQFVSDASHELRTPLAVIRSCISVRPPNYAETIQYECVHMGNLIEDMLTLTSLENHSQPLVMEWIEADTLLLHIYEEMEPLCLEKSLGLSVILPDEALPKVRANPMRLKHLLLILIHNAISYTPPKGQIALKASHDHKWIVFQVTDTGTGISDEDKNRVFDRFYRTDKSHTGKEHFGLGLCIAKEIIQAHKGTITITDNPGGGTVFTCCIPL